MNNLPISLFNTAQFALEVLKIRPLLCHQWQGKSYLCSGCQAGDVFECVSCRRLVPFCQGCDDNFGEFCDQCWKEMTEF